MSIKTEPEPKATAPKQVNAGPTRQQQRSKLLNRKSGASIAQMQQAFGWQPHTARAALSTLRKAGTVIERSDSGKGSIYRIAGKG